MKVIEKILNYPNMIEKAYLLGEEERLKKELMQCQLRIIKLTKKNK